MEDWAQRKNARNLSQKCSYSYDGLFNLDPLVNLQLPQSNSSTLDGMKNKQLRLNSAINGIKAERPVDSQSEMTFKRKRFSVEAEVGCNVVKRDDADSNDEGEGSNGFHIAEEDYRSMLGEHLKKLRRVQLKEAIADRIGSSLNKGMDFVPRRIHVNSKKNHSFRAGWHDQYRVESDEKLPDKDGDGIMMLYENGSYHSNSNTGRNATTVTTDGGDSMPNVIDLGSGILFEIPPPYDELATDLHLPNFQSMQIDDKLLTGHLKPTVVASIVASDPLVKLWKTQARIGGAYDKVPVSELSMHAAESKLYDLETGAKNFSLQIFDCSGPQSVTENSSSVGNGADLESLDFKQDSEYTWRGILSENGLVRQWEVRVLQRTDGYEVIERKIPKKEPVKIDPTAVAKEDCDKVAKYWVNLVRKELPKHHKIFTLYYRKQTLDAKKYAEFCQREVRYKVTRSVKLTRAAPTRIRKLSRDMVIFWKKVDKEQAELKKKEEREAAEALKREEELREARRQQQRLNFLLTQTELYSHFMQNKLAGTAATSTEEEKEAAVPIDQPGDVEVSMMSAEEAAEEAAMKEEALKAAQNAALKQKRKTDDFDSECLKFREITGLEGLSQAVETADGIDLVNPSTMPTASTVQQPSLFQGILKEYQLKGLQWLVNCYEQGLNGILADEMGLGKTIQAMSFLAHLAEEKNIWGPFLVVAPSSVLSNWADEIRRFCPVLKILPYWGALSERTIFRKNLSPKRLYKRDATFHILITSYQLLVTDDKYLRRVKWQYMVLDEAQAIKSANSMRWKTLLSFNCRNRLLLTGTPIQNNMAELWALLHFIMPTLFDNHDQFNEWFSKGIENHAEHGGTLNEHQLNRLHSILKPFMLRRVKKDVITEMSNKKEVVIPCSLSSRQQAFYQAIKNKISISDLFDSSGALLNDKKVMNLMNIVIQLRKVCNHPELFERNEGRTFVHFSVISCSLLPPPFGEPEYIQYAGGHNPIRYQVPKLLYRDGMCCVPTHRSGSIQGFRDRWVHNMLSFFSPANLYASIFMHKAASADATSTAYSGPVGFFCLLDMSISEVGFVARASFMERLLFSWVEEVTCSLEEVVVEDLENDVVGDLENVVKESKVRAVNKLLLDPFRHNLSCLRRKLAVGVESEPFEALVVPHQVRFLRNIRLLRSVNTFMPAVRAPQIEVVCTDRGFGYQRGEDLHNPWLKRLFLGHARTSEYNGPAMPGSCHYLIQEKETIIYAQQPFLSLPYRIFGSTPPLQSCDFAKKLTDSGKLQTLDALLKGLRADNHRVLLFAQMTKMLNILEDYMNYRKYKYLRLDGSSSIMDRRDMVNDFQHRSDIFIFLLSTRAGGLGINLTAADTVIFYESDWNPTMDLQAMDRAHRLGQTREVTVYRLICKGTIEEKIVKRASQKNTVQQLVMTGGGQSQGDIFEAEEVVSLLLDDAELEQKMREQVLKPGVKMEKRKRVFGVSSGAKAVRVDAEGIASLEEDIVIEKTTEAKDVPENGNKQHQGKRKNDGEGKPPKPPKAPKTAKVNVEALETKSPIEPKEFANPKSRSKSRKSLLDACEGNAAYGEHNNSQSAKESSSRTVPVVKVRMPFLKNAKANCNNNTINNNSKMDPRKDATITLLSTQFDANNMGLSPEEYLNDEDLPNPIAT